jgi:phosphoribosyl 1,2-cyclic phosphodiesterase
MMRFSVLASGSSGNASLLEFDNFGLLIDAGLGPRQMASRLAAVGAAWGRVNAVLLTHTHSDHWKDRTLGQLTQLKIPLYCHAEHHGVLDTYGPSFAKLARAGLVRGYERGCDLWLTPALRCRPLEVLHDSTPTFGFRIDGTEGLFGQTWSLGFLSDLGCWSGELVESIAGVDVLALEFNHDEMMERGSRRPAELIDRVLGDRGHLSNDQAAEFLRAIVTRSGPDGLQHVVQLHLSRECNRHYLAQAAARVALDALGRQTPVHTASQDRVGPILALDATTNSVRKFARSGSRGGRVVTQPSLPGME